MRDAGHLAMGGQIVDATVVGLAAKAHRGQEGDGQGRRRARGSKRAQLNTDGRWTIKRGRRRPPRLGETRGLVTTAIAVPVFGYKNHVGIDRRHGFIRSFAVTDAARHDGRQLGQLLDPHNTASPVWPMSRTARRPTSRCWRAAGWCRSSSDQSRVASQ